MFLGIYIRFFANFEFTFPEKIVEPRKKTHANFKAFS